jgi:hypothetical protein
MQCPDCSSEVDDAVVFCPHCRYQFKEMEETGNDQPFPARTPGSKRPAIEKPETFTKKEIKQLEIHLLQPALVLVLTVSLFLYIVTPDMSVFQIMLSGQKLELRGAMCLFVGLLAGIIFFLLYRRGVRKFRA